MLAKCSLGLQVFLTVLTLWHAIEAVLVWLVVLGIVWVDGDKFFMFKCQVFRGGKVDPTFWAGHASDRWRDGNNWGVLQCFRGEFLVSKVCLLPEALNVRRVRDVVVFGL